MCVYSCANTTHISTSLILKLDETILSFTSADTGPSTHVYNPLHHILVSLPEESPDPAEVFTVVRVAETKVALKSGYGRYLGVNTAGELTGTAEAVGSRETWEPVFEEVRH